MNDLSITNPPSSHVPEFKINEVRRYNATLLNPFHIIIPTGDYQGRVEVPSREKLDELKESVRDNGVIMPIRMCKNHLSQAEVIAGMCRLLVSRELFQEEHCETCGTTEPWLLDRKVQESHNCPKIRFYIPGVMDANLKPEQRFSITCTENESRNPWNPMDYAHQIAIWRRHHKYTTEQIARVYHKSVQWVSDHESLNRLPAATAAAVAAKTIPVQAGVVLTGVAPDQHETVLDAAASHYPEGSAKKGKITTTAVKAAAEKVGKQNPGSAKPIRRTLADLRKLLAASNSERGNQLSLALQCWLDGSGADGDLLEVINGG